MSIAVSVRRKTNKILHRPRNYFGALKGHVCPVKDEPYALSLAGEGVKVYAAPFPHAVQDNVIPHADFKKMLEHWPEKSVFPESRSDGCRIAQITEERVWAALPPASRDFWSEFVRVHCVNMVRTSMLAYGAKPVHKY